MLPGWRERALDLWEESRLLAFLRWARGGDSLGSLAMASALEVMKVVLFS